MRKWLVVDVDQLEGVLGDRTARRSHADHWLTLVGGPADGKSVVRDGRGARHRAEDADRLGPLGDLRAREDLEHTLELESSGNDDGFDPGVRVRAPPDGHVDGMRRVEVVGKKAGPAEQPVVFLTELVGAEDASSQDDGRRRRQGGDVSHRRLPASRQGIARRRSG